MPVGCMLGAQTPDLISKKQGLIYRYLQPDKNEANFREEFSCRVLLHLRSLKMTNEALTEPTMPPGQTSAHMCLQLTETQILSP